MAKRKMSHEEYIQKVRNIAVAGAKLPLTAKRALLAAKLVYGVGHQSARGRCHYDAWSGKLEVLEIAALTQESEVQLAGTTIHELAHSLAGSGSGHGPEWKDCCTTLGLLDAQAAGMAYEPKHFRDWKKIAKLGKPTDGKPTFGMRKLTTSKKFGCQAGVGTRGGKTAGVGSGSSLRLWECQCPDGTVGKKVRVSSDEWDATCNKCDEKYVLQSKPVAKGVARHAGGQ